MFKNNLRHLWSNFRYLLAGVLALALLTGLFVLYLFGQRNFHIVSARNGIYRSGQLDAAAIKSLASEHGVRTILNLRGPGGGSWYAEEIQTSRDLGINHIDFQLDANQELTDGEMDNLLALISSAPKPILIHCKSGADRTGLAGALYLYSQEGLPAQSAVQELSPWCGHIPYLFWRDTIAMDRSFWRYVDKHAQPGIASKVMPIASAATTDSVLLPAN